MGEKVNFDPINKFINEIQPSGTIDNSLDVVVDIYSDAKEDWRGSDFLSGFEFPLFVIGGDPITAEKSVTPRYFLASGWKFKPYEGDHELTIVGDIFSDLPRLGLPSEPLHIAVSGAFTVSVIFQRTFDAFTTVTTEVVEVSGAVTTDELFPSFIG
jgi:hypothetical protein